MLDGAFVLEDYDRTLRLLEEGIPDREPEWHEMAITKVKAHKALQEGRPLDAVRHFREFMKFVEQREEPERDPSTGILHTREMSLGRNAKRIGDILREAGQDEEARRAYEEAEQYYAAALEEVEPDSREADLIRTEKAQIPPSR
jgi:hypothetical protein